MTLGLLVFCGMVGPLRVSAEDALYCPMVLSATRDAMAAQTHRPEGRWHVIFTQEYILYNGKVLRGATQQSHRRIYVVTAEPLTIFHELHHAWESERGQWLDSVTHAHWTCKDWELERDYTGAPPTWANICERVP